MSTSDGGIIGHEWLEQASAYALGALDARDEAAFQAHLETCEICRREVQTMGEVAGLLAASPKQLEPPAGLRDRILSEARQVRPLTARATPVHDTTDSDEIAEMFAAEARPPARAPVTPRAQPATRPATRGGGSRFVATLGWFAAAASIAIAAVLGSMYLRQRDDLVSYARVDAQLKRDVLRRDSVIATRDSMVASLIAPDVQTVTLVATGRPPSARLYVNRRARRVILAAFALPPAPGGRIYQLWGLRKEGGSPVSLGLFNTKTDSSGLAVLDIPPGVALVASAITEEPSGGSAAPTTTPFLIAQWKGG